MSYNNINSFRMWSIWSYGVPENSTILPRCTRESAPLLLSIRRPLLAETSLAHSSFPGACVRNGNDHDATKIWFYPHPLRRYWLANICSYLPISETMWCPSANWYFLPSVVSVLKLYDYFLPFPTIGPELERAILFLHEYIQWCPFGSGVFNDFAGELSIDFLFF